MGMVLLLYSSMAISSGSIRVVAISKGAPIDICRALAPIILARSYRVYVCVCILRPQNDSLFNGTMGSLRFELRSLRPERNRMVQATLRPPHSHIDLLVRVEFINDLFMGQKHAPAAVPGNIQIVEDLFGILAFLPPLPELFPRC
jgi:hypothetical protein